MLSEPKSIFFQTELEWPPLEQWTVSKDTIRHLYNKMFGPDGYTYDNLDLQSEKPTLSRRSESGQSLCQFGPNSITLEESHECQVGAFSEAVQTVLGGLQKSDIPPFFHQRVKIQCLAQPANCRNTVELLAGRAARVYENIAPFERPPSFFGIRFRFSPTQLLHPKEGEGEGEGEANGLTEEVVQRAVAEGRVEDKPGFITLRFESYARDPQQVWMEVAAGYLADGEPWAVTDTSAIIGNINDSYKFLTVNGKRFLDQFDTKHEGTEG